MELERCTDEGESGALLAISVRGHVGLWDWIIDKAEPASYGT